ncbi:TetR/AcrR family transcriptional regulator [Pseudonocardia sp. GCM10023141]|uniref:TetR/AcrR family transcriptional regulator n=1 Tax=Pseudonocardia sp. GCM10023141 TaxID=3252653 RepID=UPI0036160E67
MAYDSAATRTRLLDAAHAEFVERGLAGARVDRIAAAAAANKQAIYAYFGSKDALFDAVLDAKLRVLADLVPFTPDDLPGYIGALFDQLVADPGLLRLTQWKALERTDASPTELAAHLQKAAELAGAHDSTTERAMDAMMITLAVAQAWSTTAPTIRNPDGSDETERLARHRDAVVASAAAVTAALLA